MSKEETASPTVSTEALFIQCLIDTLERRDVETCDIPGAFMQADMEGKTVHVKLEGVVARIMLSIDDTLYRKYTVQENGRPVIYIELEKALYRTVQAAMLFYKNLTTQLEK